MINNTGALTDEYYNKTAPEWAGSHNTANFWGEHMVRFHELLPSGKILEIGSGAGRDAKELIELGYDYLGIDPSEGMLNIAKETNPSAEFLNIGISDLDKENEFDGFWASASLLHIPKNQMDQALQNIHKAMKTGAIGFISLKKHIDDGADERVEKDDKGERFFSYWTEEGFEEVLKKNGFELAAEVVEKKVGERTTWLIFQVRTLKES